MGVIGNMLGSDLPDGGMRFGRMMMEDLQGLVSHPKSGLTENQMHAVNECIQRLLYFELKGRNVMITSFQRRQILAALDAGNCPDLSSLEDSPL